MSNNTTTTTTTTTLQTAETTSAAAVNAKTPTERLGVDAKREYNLAVSETLANYDVIMGRLGKRVAVAFLRDAAGLSGKTKDLVNALSAKYDRDNY